MIEMTIKVIHTKGSCISKNIGSNLDQTVIIADITPTIITAMCNSPNNIAVVKYVDAQHNVNKSESLNINAINNSMVAKLNARHNINV
jgi:hypothetical protein